MATSTPDASNRYGGTGAGSRAGGEATQAEVIALKYRPESQPAGDSKIAIQLWGANRPSWTPSEKERRCEFREHREVAHVQGCQLVAGHRAVPAIR